MVVLAVVVDGSADGLLLLVSKLCLGLKLWWTRPEMELLEVLLSRWLEEARGFKSAKRCSTAADSAGCTEGGELTCFRDSSASRVAQYY